MKPKYKFICLLQGSDRTLIRKDEEKECSSFEEAFTKMFNYVNGRLDTSNMSYQELETAIWIESPDGLPIFFYDARDLAIKIGILVDGKLI